ncbi:hypothetical protein AB0N31_25955 [Streptomyces sp. NPDC051051]|uniref:hypothetical protein n=1 Tax=Streptomyces sp. NPDC051051 TaxID=3155666 RepID=UPI00342B303A
MVHRLVQGDPAVVAPLDDHRVLQLGQMLLGQLEQLVAHLAGGGEVVVGDDEEIARQGTPFDLARAVLADSRRREKGMHVE